MHCLNLRGALLSGAVLIVSSTLGCSDDEGDGATPGSGGTPPGGTAGAGGEVVMAGSGGTAGDAGAPGTAGTGGGAAGTAGGVGTGGTGPRPDPCEGKLQVATGSDPLIDDLELVPGDAAPDHQIREVDGRFGFWYTYNDPSSGTQNPSGGFVPLGEGANGTLTSARTWGGGFTGYGAGLGVGLNNDLAGHNCPYDASVYGGISFYAKGNNIRVKFSAVIPATTPIDEGGTCDVPDPNDCRDPHAIFVDLTEEWQLFEIEWSDLVQGGWGVPATFTPAEIRNFQWQYSDGEPFDFSIDDLSFFVTPTGGGGGAGGGIP